MKTLGMIISLIFIFCLLNIFFSDPLFWFSILYPFMVFCYLVLDFLYTQGRDD
jgi:hypothetical protein